MCIFRCKQTPDTGQERDATQRTAIEQAEHSERKTYKHATGWTLAMLALTLSAIISFAAQSGHFWSVLGTGIVVAAAAAFTGALLGFIFGVPRALTSGRPRGAGVFSLIAPNTNLEQISDWLTKILVGVGLTQFAPIARAIGRLFTNLSPSFGGGDGGTAFAGGLVVFMVTFGFSDGWLFTRLFLSNAMAVVDRAATEDTQKAFNKCMDKARDAEKSGDVEAARIYRTQARELLKQWASIMEPVSSASVLVEGEPPPLPRRIGHRKR